MQLNPQELQYLMDQRRRSQYYYYQHMAQLQNIQLIRNLLKKRISLDLYPELKQIYDAIVAEKGEDFFIFDDGEFMTTEEQEYATI